MKLVNALVEMEIVTTEPIKYKPQLKKQTALLQMRA